MMSSETASVNFPCPVLTYSTSSSSVCRFISFSRTLSEGSMKSKVKAQRCSFRTNSSCFSGLGTSLKLGKTSEYIFLKFSSFMAGSGGLSSTAAGWLLAAPCCLTPVVAVFPVEARSLLGCWYCGVFACGVGSSFPEVGFLLPDSFCFILLSILARQVRGRELPPQRAILTAGKISAYLCVITSASRALRPGSPSSVGPSAQLSRCTTYDHEQVRQVGPRAEGSGFNKPQIKSRLG
mmetsp:Transcript_93/g.166  ORF Transcript_93/g.166 Transcript_93/m.166 type:complete len:236 (+) Transcript_93:1323-2030(+)